MTELTQADVDAAVARISERRRRGIEAPIRGDYDLSVLRADLTKQDVGIADVERQIDQASRHRNELRQQLSEQELLHQAVSEGRVLFEDVSNRIVPLNVVRSAIEQEGITIRKLEEGVDLLRGVKRETRKLIADEEAKRE